MFLITSMWLSTSQIDKPYTMELEGVFKIKSKQPSGAVFAANK